MKKNLLLVGALTLAAGANAQNWVNTGGQKHVLVEEGTGAWCQYCPDGTVRLISLLNTNDKVVGVSFHNGDGMVIAETDSLEDAWVSGWPTGFVDRVPYTAVSATNIEINRGYWASAVTARQSSTASVDVTLKHGYNSTTRVLTVVVKAKTLAALTGNFALNAYITEDSVTGTGSGFNQKNYYNTQSGHPMYGLGNPIVGFNHRHVLRKMMGGAWGTRGIIAANSATNKTYEVTYTWTVPASMNVSRMKVVGLVQRWDAANAANREVMNVVEAKLTPGALAVTEVNALQTVSVFPNPADNQIHLEAATDQDGSYVVSVLNTVGQQVASQQATAVNGKLSVTINTAELPTGMYLVRVAGEQGSTASQVMVTH